MLRLVQLLSSFSFMPVKKKKKNLMLTSEMYYCSRIICCMDSKAATDITWLENCLHNFLRIMYRDTPNLVTKNWMKSCVKNHFPRVLRHPLPNGKNMYFQVQELISFFTLDKVVEKWFQGTKGLKALWRTKL